VFQGSRLRVARRILATGILNRFRQKSGADWTLDYFISQSKIALGTRISSVSPRAMVQICPRAPVSTPISADLGTNSFYGCLTVSRKPFFRPQATSFCIFPRLPAAHLPVSSDLGTYPFSGRLIVNRKPFFRLQATSFCVVPRSPAAHLPKPTKHSTISSTVPASSRTWLSDAKSQCNKPERSSFIASTAVPVVHAETKHDLTLAGRNSTGSNEHPVSRTWIADCNAQCGASYQIYTHPIDAVGRYSSLLREFSSDHGSLQTRR
jgi:hypothetical protein